MPFSPCSRGAVNFHINKYTAGGEELKKMYILCYGKVGKVRRRGRGGGRGIVAAAARAEQLLRRAALCRKPW
jgi:hypothetical protein